MVKVDLSKVGGIPLPGGPLPVAPINLNQRVLLDYNGRTDSNPVFIGLNTQDQPIEANTWTIIQLFYDSNSPVRLTDKQILTNVSWSNRSTLSWRSANGD